MRSLTDRRILLVEDDYLMAQDLQAELESAGAEVLGRCRTSRGRWSS